MCMAEKNFRPGVSDGLTNLGLELFMSHTFPLSDRPKKTSKIKIAILQFSDHLSRREKKFSHGSHI
jgi:hypothetical protein